MKNSALFTALSRTPDVIALEGCGMIVHYGALLQEAQTLGQKLKGAHAVAILMQNTPVWLIADLSCVAAEIPCVPLPPFFTSEQIDHALKDAGVNIVLTDQPERFTGEARKIMVAGKEISVIEQDNPAVDLPPGTAKITYTSGTTGTPKGVCLSQVAMETVAVSLVEVLGKNISTRHVCLLPLAVLLENVAGVYASLLAGATCCIEPIAHEPLALATAIREHAATSCILVPELLRMLLAAQKSLPSLRYTAVGGARVDPALLHTARERGIPAYEGYGLSECASVVTLNTPDSFRVGSTGKALPHVEIKISDDGEVRVKNPLFSGYLGNPSPQEKWYATGDIGELDADGFLHIYGRKKNILITSFGRNVSPEWPESALTSHPAIAQAIVFGDAKPFLCAVIVPRNVSEVSQAIAYANSRLPEYARIGGYVIASTPFMPQNGQLTGSGKLIRSAIHQAYTDQIDTIYSQIQEVSA